MEGSEQEQYQQCSLKRLCLDEAHRVWSMEQISKSKVYLELHGAEASKRCNGVKVAVPCGHVLDCSRGRE